MKSVMPFIIMVICVSMYFFYIKPTYDVIQTRRAKFVEYQTVLNKVKEIKSIRDELSTKYGNISEQDLNKIDKMIPGKFIPEYFVNDLNGIATKFGMKVNQMEINIPPASSVPTDSVLDGGVKYSTVTAKFNLTGTYDQFLMFLKDVESSLRIVDVIGFSVRSKGVSEKDKQVVDTSGGVLDYTVEVKTYSLK